MFCGPLLPEAEGIFITMETLAAQPTHEKLKSFDVLASVDMLRFDVLSYGEILPETRERVRDEELSYLTEGVERAARTSFVLKRNEQNQLIYFHNGEWRPYVGMLMTGLRTAQEESTKDYRRAFLTERAQQDLQIGYKMAALEPGKSRTWYSAYPDEAARRHGDKFMEETGFSPRRRMGFLYRAEALEDGSILLESQTVDNSDERAFSAAMFESHTDPDASLDTLLEAYDKKLSHLLQRRTYAGRPEAEPGENAWLELRQHNDLAHYLLQGLEDLAWRSDLSRPVLEDAAKRHRYGVWATLKSRLDNGRQARVSEYGYSGMQRAIQLEQEVRRAFTQFVETGQVQSGCGGSIKITQGEAAIMEADASDVFKSIFGSKTKEELSWHGGKIKKGTCVNCKEFTEVGVKNWCKGCIKCGTE